MTDLADIERRIAGALGRISAGLDRIGGMTVPPGTETAAVQAELDAERSANAQLTERVRAIREKQETTVAMLEKTVARLKDQVEAQSRELARQKQLNLDLSETNSALAAAAVEGGVSDAALINRAMASELEALRGARAAEVAELDEILAELRPLIGEVA
jgi:hypothetical protein